MLTTMILPTLSVPVSISRLKSWATLLHMLIRISPSDQVVLGDYRQEGWLLKTLQSINRGWSAMNRHCRAAVPRPFIHATPMTIIR